MRCSSVLQSVLMKDRGPFPMTDSRIDSHWIVPAAIRQRNKIVTVQPDIDVQLLQLPRITSGILCSLWWVIDIPHNLFLAEASSSQIDLDMDRSFSISIITLWETFDIEDLSRVSGADPISSQTHQTPAVMYLLVFGIWLRTLAGWVMDIAKSSASTAPRRTVTREPCLLA